MTAPLCTWSLVDISTIPTPYYPHGPLPHLMFPRLAPDIRQGFHFVLSAKPTPPLSTGPLVSFPQVRHCMDGVGFGRGSVPIPPAGRRVPIDGRRGLTGIDLSPTSCYISSRSPSTSFILYSQPVIDSPVDVLVEWFLFFFEPYRFPFIS